MTNNGQNSYDPYGKLVMDGTGAFYIWSVQGKKLGTYTVSWNGSGTPTVAVQTKFGYFGGKIIGAAQDRLGSVRAATYAGTTEYDYQPYGAADPNGGFAMYATYQEFGAGMFYADRRFYNPQIGKFSAPIRRLTTSTRQTQGASMHTCTPMMTRLISMIPPARSCRCPSPNLRRTSDPTQ